MRVREHEKSYRVSFDNGICLDVLKRGNLYAGLGEVSLRRRKLRSGAVPIMPLIRTPDGYEVSRLQIHDVERGRESLTFTLNPCVTCCGNMEWVCYDGEDRWNVGPWEHPPERDRGGSVRIVLSAVTRTLGGLDFAGFSYAVKFRSRRYRIYRIHDRATWELGGSVTGNTFWMQGPFNEPQKTFHNRNDEFTTAWRCPAEGGPALLQQFLPFFTVLQGFTFQFDPQHLLVSAFEAPCHCRSLFQKDAGQNHLVHWHQLCTDLSGSVEFPALQVLCAENPGGAPARLADCYCDIREELHRAYTEQCGLVREAAVAGSSLLIGERPGAESLRRGVDELARAGCQRVYAPGLLGQLAPAEGWTSAELQEARRRAGRVVEHAHSRGMEVALSLSDCCHPWVQEAAREAGAPVASGDLAPEAVGPVSPARALRDAIGRQALLAHLKGVRRSLGVDGVFSDGLLEEIAGEFDWGLPEPAGVLPAGGTVPTGSAGRVGEIRSLAEARLALTVALQQLRFRCPAVGVGSIHGPYSGPSAVGCEFMFRDRALMLPHAEAARGGLDPHAAYFRGCANRLCYVTTYDAEKGPPQELAEWWKEGLPAVNKAYHAVREYMERSRQLPEDRGVLWSGPDPDVSVLWCYRRFEWPVGPPADIFDVIAARRVDLAQGTFSPQPWRVYVVQNADGP
jgi:hypothetical protein